MMPGVQFEEVWKALYTGYTQNSLTILLRTRLDMMLGNIVAPGNLQDVAFDLLSTSEREGWTTDLIREAYRFNPRNQDLLKIYEKYGLAPAAYTETAGADKQKATLGGEGFEKRIKGRIPDLDMAVWREKMARIEPCVCRVEINNRAAGTGFLVGPEAVMTNWHVVKNVIEGKVAAAAVNCRFDYKQYADGTRSEGITVGLHATEWKQDFSPYSAADGTANLPDPGELDYALLKLARAIGNERLNPAAPESPSRGWIAIPDPAPTLQPKDPLLIAQHPDGRPITLAVDTEAVIAVNANGTRVRYATNTEAGSSGSPCFEMKDWTLAALHHYGDPAAERPPLYNQGVPIGKIRQRIADNGKAALLGRAD